MFESKMGDRKDVVEFIAEVEKHPCIYNVTMPEYSNRAETKRAWLKIAEAMEVSEHECKEKWRKLRIAFMRSLKYTKINNQNNKPYYLYDYLAFLLPFIKIGDQQVYDHEETVTTASPAYSDEDELLTPKKNSKVESESEDDNTRNDINNHVVYINDRVVNTSLIESYNQERHRPIDIRKRKMTDDVESNPRKMFMLSLLPDVESLSEEEMRTFRRTVVSCIDNILDARKKRIERF